MAGVYLSLLRDGLHKARDYAANLLFGKIWPDGGQFEVLIAEGDYRARNINDLAFFAKYGPRDIDAGTLSQVTKRVQMDRRVKESMESRMRRLDLDRYEKGAVEEKMKEMDGVLEASVRTIYRTKVPVA